MLIIVYGNDTLRVKEKVEEMKARFKKKFDPNGMNLASFPSSKGVSEQGCLIGEVMQAAQTPPFLGEKRMVVIKNLLAGMKKADAEKWAAGFSKTPESSIVVFWETAETKKLEKSALYKELVKLADVYQYPFAELSGHELTKWAKARAVALGANITEQALSQLVRRVGPDLWRMHNELEKLIAYASGLQSEAEQSPGGKEPGATQENKTIDRTVTIEAVQKLVQAQFEDQIFDFVDAVSRKNMKQAMQLLEKQRLYGAADQQIFSMLARQIRILLGARVLLDENPSATGQELAKSMGLHPFVAGKAMNQAGKFNTEALKSAHRALFKLDRAVKTGKADPDIAVDLTVLKLASS